MVIKTQAPEISLSITDTQLEQLAIRVAEVLSKRLVLPGDSGTVVSRQAQSMLVEMDESIVDVGVSTKGLEKPEEIELAQEVSTVDNISGGVNKLKYLKKGNIPETD